MSSWTEDSGYVRNRSSSPVLRVLDHSPDCECALCESVLDEGENPLNRMSRLIKTMPSFHKEPALIIDDGDDDVPKALQDLKIPQLYSSWIRKEADVSLRKEPIDIETLCFMLQKTKMFSHANIVKYLTNYDMDEVKEVLGRRYKNFPVICYAVGRDCIKCVQSLLDYGADANARIDNDVPILAFTIFHTLSQRRQTIESVKLLLMFGADPNVIPCDMWKDFTLQPKRISADDHAEAAKWCAPKYRNVLVTTLNLSQRYYLLRASLQEKPNERATQIAKLHKLRGVFSTPYQLIGQTYATATVQKETLNHLLTGEKKPLVLVFAGPSGHGKTEFARKLGSLLCIPSHFVDCTEMKHETDLFGPKAPYQGWIVGSPLNNYLVDNGGKRNIVFLDEFEKTTEEVWQALLLVLDSGFYRDRRFGQQVDCKKTIWIFATNCVDSTIDRFFMRHLENKTAQNMLDAPYAELRRNLRKEMFATFGKPLSGRFTAIIPFFPFTSDEAAVVVHKLISDKAEQFREPINTCELSTGHLYINVVKDGPLCKCIAEDGYDRNTGARSLDDVVRTDVIEPINELFLEIGTEITTEINNGPLVQMTVQLHPGSDGELVPEVSRDEDIDLAGNV